MSTARIRRDYQLQGVQYALDIGDPALYWQMRLGKSLAAIDIVNTWKAEKILVIAPMSALFSWEDELKLEGEDSLAFLLGTATQRRQTLETGKAKWCLMNKVGHLVFRSVTKHRRGQDEWWDPILTDQDWDAVIIDESTFIRNPKASVSKFLTRHFRNVPHRMILSGMPNPEGLLDFFQQFKFLDGGETFGDNYWHFRAKHFRNDDGFHWTPKHYARDMITDAVRKRASVIRRKDVNLDVPIIFERRRTFLPANMRRTYEKAEEEFILEYEGKEIDRTVYKVAVYNWLRHVASGFIGGELKWKGKMGTLLELLAGDLLGEPLVVWFDYNEGLFACRRHLMQAGYSIRTIVGTPWMSRKRRRISYDNWRAGKAQLLLAQPRCLQYGADLSRADVQVFFTTPLSNEIRTQAMERILMPGKTGLLCIDLTTHNTVDDDTYTLVHKKRVDSVRTMDACSMMTERRKQWRRKAR